MYGLLLDSIYYYLRTVFGEDKLSEIRKLANINHTSFSPHQVYSETVIPRLARAAEDVTGMPMDELMESFGIAFVSYVSRYGYDSILKVLGRNLSDFLNNLDNLHEYLRFSYPKIKPPSFFVTNETSDGLTLHYRSKRKFFKSYVKGQVRQVGKVFYNTDIKCEEITAEEIQGVSYCELRLSFDNSHSLTGVALQSVPRNKDKDLSITSDVFYSLFPFHIVLNKDLVITSVGNGVDFVLPRLPGSQIEDLFHLDRPLIDFNWESILMHTNNIFELQSVDSIDNRDDGDVEVGEEGSSYMDDTTSIVSDYRHSENTTLRLRGQMLHLEHSESILFLATPVMENLDQMFKIGLFITDLSIHDSSRELLMAGTQQSAELQLLLDQEQVKSQTLKTNMKKLDAEMKKTDQLLYQMIPKSVADRLRAGEPSVSTCEVIDLCTILFSDVVGFTQICSAISPMQVVCMLNSMYTAFDALIEKHALYKVETIGDAYMIAGGVPEPLDNHAVNVAKMALEMLDIITNHKDPSDRKGKEHLQLRIGIHSGTVVGGVVGVKMPRYCLFGDTVNTASRMESTGEPMRIHCSERTMECLADLPKYHFEKRGTVEVKGKGSLPTYWLTAVQSALHNTKHYSPSSSTTFSSSMSPTGPQYGTKSKRNVTLALPDNPKRPQSIVRQATPPPRPVLQYRDELTEQYADPVLTCSGIFEYSNWLGSDNMGMIHAEPTVENRPIDKNVMTLSQEVEREGSTPGSAKTAAQRPLSASSAVHSQLAMTNRIVAAVEPSPIKPPLLKQRIPRYSQRQPLDNHVAKGGNGCSTICTLL